MDHDGGLAHLLDSVSADERVSGTTLSAIGRLAQTRKTIYLPTHDPQSAARLAARQLVQASLNNSSVIAKGGAAA